MKTILVLAEFYEPFVKGGGPIQSIKNIVNNLNDKFRFKIITNDRDLGDKHTQDGLTTETWTRVDNATVYYTQISLGKISNLLKNTEYDVIYLNSFFSFPLSIFPVLLNKLKIIKNKSIVLAPRGEFSTGALGLKSAKKKLFIWSANLLGLYNNVRWHATAESEKKDIINCCGQSVEIVIANNLTADYTNLQLNKTTFKKQGMINMVFISRIHPKKNLKFAISLLNSVKGEVKFKIYGPLEDKDYWKECKNIIDQLPDNIEVIYEGILNHNEILSKIQESHIFLFPTLGENYGHVISEALAGGCPVIISDQTPWINLKELEVGFDIPLNEENRFISAVQHYIDLNNEDYLEYAQKAFNYGIAKSNQDCDVEMSYKLFRF